MVQFRKIIFWCHLVVALLAMPVVVIMSATGVVLTYQRQIQDWADTRGFERYTSPEGAEEIALESIISTLQAAGSGLPNSIKKLSAADEPLVFSFEDGPTLYIDRYTGVILGERSALSEETVRPFFRDVRNLHRWLMTSGESRAIGRGITGASNLGLLFLILSGLYLWWPRNWRRSALRNVMLFRRGLSPKARDFNWHNVFGWWSLLPLLIMVSTGVVFGYQWADDLVLTVLGETSSASNSTVSNSGDADRDQVWPAQLDRLSLRELEQRATEHAPGWRSYTLQVPALADTLVEFRVYAAAGGQPHKTASIGFDWRTGERLLWEPFAAQSLGHRANRVIRFAHTGEWLGVIGQTIAGIFTLASLFLVWTGCSLSLRRLREWRKRARRGTG